MTMLFRNPFSNTYWFSLSLLTYTNLYSLTCPSNPIAQLIFVSKIIYLYLLTHENMHFFLHIIHSFRFRHRVFFQIQTAASSYVDWTRVRSPIRWPRRVHEGVEGATINTRLSISLFLMSNHVLSILSTKEITINAELMMHWLCEWLC